MWGSGWKLLEALVVKSSWNGSKAKVRWKEEGPPASIRRFGPTGEEEGEESKVSLTYW
jgi:hypothetical protein